MGKEIYFTDDEIRCKCGCDFIKYDHNHFWKINTVRGIVGHPLRVNSWCRCAIHNLSVGGSPTSSHPKGLATDLETPTEYLKYRILLAAGKVGFRGVGVGKNFIHLDSDLDKPENRFWIY